MRVSVVIPAKNEEQNILSLIREITVNIGPSIKHEIIVVDDGSSDNTHSLLLSVKKSEIPQLKVLRHKKSVGQSTAIQSAIALAKGKFIITLDGDGQNDPADIPAMLSIANSNPENSHFCVIGHRKNRKDTTWKRFQSRVANKFRRRFLNDDTPDTGCGLKIFPRNTFKLLPYFDHMHRYMPALIKRLGGTIHVVEVNHRNREFGQSNYNMLGRLRVGIVDILGVYWLLRRTKQAEFVADEQ